VYGEGRSYFTDQMVRGGTGREEQSLMACVRGGQVVFHEPDGGHEYEDRAACANGDGKQEACA
jgi:hypothetical protein